MPRFAVVPRRSTLADFHGHNAALNGLFGDQRVDASHLCRAVEVVQKATDVVQVDARAKPH